MRRRLYTAIIAHPGYSNLRTFMAKEFADVLVVRPGLSQQRSISFVWYFFANDAAFRGFQDREYRWQLRQ